MLNRIGIIFDRNYSELRGTKGFHIILIIGLIIMVAGSIGISIALKLQPWLKERAAIPLLELFISLIVYFLPLFFLLAFIWSFASLPVTKEKVNGNIEALIATPITPYELWVGKSLAIFLPAYVISIVTGVVNAVAVNLAVILPATGQLVLPTSVLILGLVINPLLFFGLLLFTVLFSLANNPEVAIMPSFILGFGLMVGLPAVMMTGAVNLASWSFTLWYLGGTVVLISIVFYLSRTLTRENIVLSSKGA